MIQYDQAKELSPEVRLLFIFGIEIVTWG
jgi:hypothetical protein